MHILQLHLFNIIVRSVGIFYKYNAIDIDVTFPPEHTPSAGLSGKRAGCMTGFNNEAAKT